MTFRSLLYKLARSLGDVNAAAKGKYPQRYVRKRTMAKANSKLLKWLKF